MRDIGFATTSCLPSKLISLPSHPSDTSNTQTHPSLRPFHHSDPPIHQAFHHSDPSITQILPSLGPFHCSDPSITQTHPSLRPIHHSDPSITQILPSLRPIHHSDPSITQTHPSLRSFHHWSPDPLKQCSGTLRLLNSQNIPLPLDQTTQHKQQDVYYPRCTQCWCGPARRVGVMVWTC